MPIRILLADMSEMLRDIVARILKREPGFEVYTAELDVTHALEETEADVVITATRDEGAQLDILWLHPRLRVLVLRDDGREASLYRLQPQERFLGKVSPESLVEAIRDSTVSY